LFSATALDRLLAALEKNVDMMALAHASALSEGGSSSTISRLLEMLGKGSRRREPGHAAPATIAVFPNRAIPNPSKLFDRS
jgi:hypothetical protein